MIKKYKEFLESKDKEYILTIKLEELNADYEFHKKISPIINESENAWEEYYEYQKHYSYTNKGEYEIIHDKHDKYIKMLQKLKIAIKSYTYEFLKSNNNLKFNMYLLDLSSDFGDVYTMFFVGSKSNLEEINRYYGIIDNKNIRIFDAYQNGNGLIDSPDWVMMDNKSYVDLLENPPYHN